VCVLVRAESRPRRATVRTGTGPNQRCKNVSTPAIKHTVSTSVCANSVPNISNTLDIRSATLARGGRGVGACGRKETEPWRLTG
jgi:hypothetical protein